MNEKMKQDMQEWKYDDMDMSDIMETISVSKQIVKDLPVKKYNASLRSQLFSISRYHMPKVMIAQAIFSVALLLIGSQSLLKVGVTVGSFDRLLYSFIMFFSAICMVSTSSEMIRIRLMGTWEMEKVCFINPQKVLIFKMLILASLSTVLILLLSFLFSSVFHLSFIEVFFYAYVPFLLLTACILQISAFIKSYEAVMGAYASGMVILYNLGLFFLEGNIDDIVYILILVLSMMFFMQSVHQYTKSLNQGERGII